MSIFERRFPIEKIADQMLEKNLWFKDMLGAWRPAGDALRRDMRVTHVNEDHGRLRLAIRNGYLNLYRGGQSIAKVSFSRKEELRAHVHSKYVHGRTGRGQTYVTLTSEGLDSHETTELRRYKGLADLRVWVANANEYVGDEKRFVDLIVARNPDTIDLEMALPAYDPKKRIAPRMDLVALEPVRDRWQIVFWEAKRAKDDRARCRSPEAPEVVEQLARYTDWLSDADRRDRVARAYQNTCRLLVKFRELAKRENPGIEELGPGIVAAAVEGAPPLLVDVKPRILIDNRKGDASFTQNGHLQKLRDAPHNFHVQTVSGWNDMALERCS